MSVTIPVCVGSQNEAIWQNTPNDGTILTSRCHKDVAQSGITSAADITELNLPIKMQSSYSFSYDIVYSVSGLLCGVQFAVVFNGTLLSMGYGVQVQTIGGGSVSTATFSAGTFIGSGATLAGGGPACARIFGAMKSGGLVGADLIIRAQAVGVAASVTIHPNSCGKAEEQ